MIDSTNFLWFYRANPVRVIDGDTVELLVDLGFHIYQRMRVRLYGIDAPELNSSDPAVRQAAIEAKEWLVVQLFSGANEWPLLINSHLDKADKYGRPLATIYLASNPGVSLNSLMVSQNLAKAYIV